MGNFDTHQLLMRRVSGATPRKEVEDLVARYQAPFAPRTGPATLCEQTSIEWVGG